MGFEVDETTGGGGGSVNSVSGTANRITSTGGTDPVIDISATFEALLGKVANPLSQFAATTSAELRGVLSDENGTGAALFDNASGPTFSNPVVGTQSQGDNSTKAASTAYVDTGLATKSPINSQSAISASAIDWTYTHLYKTLGANTTFTFSNAADAKTIIVAITNTASNYTVAWPTVDWGSAGEPTQRTGAVTDIYTFTQINGTIYGTVRQ